MTENTTIPTQVDGNPHESPKRYTKAAHLSEFYPYINGQSQQKQPQQPQTDDYNLSPNTSRESHKHQKMHSRKPSTSTLNSYSTFAPSAFDFSNLISKSEIAETTEAFTEIIDTAESYRKALSSVAEAAANFGAALENGAKSKGVGPVGEGLLNASGLFFLVANHEQILSHSIKKNFEDSITRKVNQFKLQNIKNENQFKIDIKDKIKDLKKQEYENLKISKLKTRNLVTYRSKLLELTTQIDDIDKLKHAYYQNSFDLVQDASNTILTQLGTIIRAQVEIYEGIARKGWSGGGLDDLIAQCPDPFAQEEEVPEETKDRKDDNKIYFNKNYTVNSQIQLSSTALTIKRDSEPELTTLSQPLTAPFQTDSKTNSPISKSTLLDALEAQNERSRSEDEYSDSLDNDTKARHLSLSISPRHATETPKPMGVQLYGHKEEDEEEERDDKDKQEEQDNDEEEINEDLANITLEDDNSFSLPMPGSSRSTKSPEQLNDEETPENGEGGTESVLQSEHHQVWR